jgi:hypothetical protein
MFAQQYNSGAAEKNERKFFTHRRDAHLNGFFQAWELERQGRKPVGEADAWLVQVREATPAEKEIFRGWEFDSLEWLDDDTVLEKASKLYHISNTRPYRPTEKTKAIWLYQDLFVPTWKKWAEQVGDGWEVETADSYRYGLNTSRVRQHLHGYYTLGMVGNTFTNFVACRAENSEDARRILEEFGQIKSELWATRWFCEVDQRGINVFFLFDGRNKTRRATQNLSCILRRLGVQAVVAPNETGFRLPLSLQARCLTDRHITDVVELAEWINDPDAKNMEVANILGEFRKLQEQKLEFDSNYQDIQVLGIVHEVCEPKDRHQETGQQHELSSTQTPHHLIPHGNLRNCCWKVVTGFWRGQTDIPLNTAISLTARFFWAGEVSESEAVRLITEYCDELPVRKSSRLQPHKRHVLLRDIKRTVKKIYDGNAGQSEPDLSTAKLNASVARWCSKGLLLWDKTTWDLTYGYVSMPEVEFNEQELKNIKVYLAPLLSSRDTKGRAPVEVAVELASAVVKLVAAKQGRELATGYLKKYIHGETGINCENRTKLARIKEALIDLGLIKVIRKGRQDYGATKYGLAGRMAELLAPEGRETESQEFQLPENMDEQLEAVVQPYETQQEVEDHHHSMDLLSITAQKGKTNGNPRMSPPQFNNRWHPTGDVILDEILSRCPKRLNHEQMERRRYALW